MHISNRAQNTITAAMAAIILISSILVCVLVVRGDVLLTSGSAAPFEAAVAAQQVAASKPVAVSQAPVITAKAVAKEFNCGRFYDTGPDQVGLSVDSGICWMNGVKYGINIFTTAGARDTWIKAAESLGSNPPRWETATMVFYKADDQTADEH